MDIALHVDSSAPCGIMFDSLHRNSRITCIHPLQRYLIETSGRTRHLEAYFLCEQSRTTPARTNVKFTLYT